MNRVLIMRKLIDLHCNIFTVTSNGSNALHIAAKQGHIDVVREILKIKEFPLNSMKKNGVTAVAIAAYKGEIDIV